MKRFRFSIGTLLVATLFVAIEISALCRTNFGLGYINRLGILEAASYLLPLVVDTALYLFMPVWAHHVTLRGLGPTDFYLVPLSFSRCGL